MGNEKTIKIDGVPCPMKCTAVTVLAYRDRYNRDVFRDMDDIRRGLKIDKAGDVAELPAGAVETIMRVAYIMARQAGAQEEEAEWLDQFSPIGLLQATGEIMELWHSANQPLSQAKKK